MGPVGSIDGAGRTARETGKVPDVRCRGTENSVKAQSAAVAFYEICVSGFHEDSKCPSTYDGVRPLVRAIDRYC